MNSQIFEKWVRDRWSHNSRGEERDLTIMGLGIGGEAGEVQELLKKHIRDGKVLDQNLLLELGDVLHYLTRIGQKFGFSLTQIMLANMDKLERRDKGEKVG
jgi:NTP pyrophosphatase (non-canonical NTP hydrolase)